jgi:formamidopyrimidine-DNA glycosylase
MIVILL